MTMEFDFEKCGTVDSLDTIPEKYRGLYAEGQSDEGKAVFKLADHARGLVADYIGTNKALTATRNDKKKASDESAARRQALKAFEDMAQSLGLEIGDDGLAAALNTFISELQGKVKDGTTQQINLDKITAEWKKRLEDAVKLERVEKDDLVGALSDHLISRSAVSALAALKARSHELLLPHVERQCKVVKGDDGKYSVRVLDTQGDFRTNSAGGWMGVEELVAEMKANPVFAPAFESDQKGGTGSTPGAHRRPPQNPDRGGNLSATDKIRIGLSKGQFARGRPN
jgi:hypothetical protein